MRLAAVVIVLAFAVLIQGCDPGPGGEALARTSAAAPASDPAIAAALPQDDPTDVVVRRLWSGEDLFGPGSMSPDGRYVSYIAMGDPPGEVAVRDLRTGDRYPLTATSNDGDRPYERWGGATEFSPDGAHLAYSWVVGDGLQVRVLDFEMGEDGAPMGRRHRVVFSSPQLRTYDLWGWSPDSREILITAQAPSGATTLMSVAVEDGSTQALKTFDGWALLSRAKFSPDGNHVVYEARTDPDSDGRELFVLSADGQSESRLEIGAPHTSVRLLEWLPDGSVLFLSERGGTPGVWRISIEEGVATGSASLVHADAWNHRPIGVANGTYFFWVAANSFSTQTAFVDLPQGRLRSTPVPLQDPDGMGPQVYEWSPGGQSLAYTTAAPEEGRTRLVFQSPAGDGGRRVSLDLRYVDGLQWWPDGGSVLLLGEGDSRPKGFYRFDIATGTLQPVVLDRDLSAPQAHYTNFQVSPDGGTLFLATYDGTTVRVIARDLTTGVERFLAMAGWQTQMALSPDGMSLAFFETPDEGISNDWLRAVSIIPAAGGEARRVYTTPPQLWLRSVNWSPDGRTLVISTMDGNRPLSAADCCALYTIPVAGGEPRPIEGIEELSEARVRLSGDGQRLAFETGRDIREIWVMEGLGSFGDAR